MSEERRSGWESQNRPALLDPSDRLILTFLACMWMSGWANKTSSQWGLVVPAAGMLSGFTSATESLA